MWNCMVELKIACLANSSALSFPGIPMWLGIHVKMTDLLCSWCCFSRLIMDVIKFMFSFSLICCKAWREDKESVCIATGPLSLEME